jgi:hypothetical protein
MAVSRGNDNGARSIDRKVLRDEAGHITDAVSRIAEMADQVSAGATAQVQSLDSALSGLNQMTASLKETATKGRDRDPQRPTPSYRRSTRSPPRSNR